MARLPRFFQIFPRYLTRVKYLRLPSSAALPDPQNYCLRAKVFPSCKECVADHFRGLHELIDANGYLEWDFVRSSVAGEIDI